MNGAAIREQAREGHEAYADPQEDRPLGGYLLLLATYLGAGAGLGTWLRRRGPLPRRIPLSDLLLAGVATHKVSRTLAKEPITSPLRAPFAHYEGVSGPAELAESVRGRGLRHAVGEMVTCPFCLGQWTATTFMTGLVVAPRATRLVASVFAVTTISDTLQLVYARLQGGDRS